MGQVTINNFSGTSWNVEADFPLDQKESISIDAASPGNPKSKTTTGNYPGKAQKIILTRTSNTGDEKKYSYKVEGVGGGDFTLTSSLNRWEFTLPDQARAAHGISGMMGDPANTNVTIGDGQ